MKFVKKDILWRNEKNIMHKFIKLKYNSAPQANSMASVWGDPQPQPMN